MECNDVLDKLKEEFPDKAIDISECLELLREIINDSIEAIGDRINTAVTNRNFDGVTQYSDMAEEINRYEKKIEEFIDMLEVERIDMLEVERIDVPGETEEEVEKKTIPNYAEYVVDSRVEHTLYENFTHKRPAAFKINDHKLIEVKTWQDVLVKTSEILMSIDGKKFISFENSSEMNGKKKKYFSRKSSDLRKAGNIDGKIFIEMNQSGNAIRNLIVKMLKKYGFKINGYKVYFRADYSNINE
ncbi:MAG: hypothetical protein WCQ87_03815 [Parabacteroides sp.]